MAYLVYEVSNSRIMRIARNGYWQEATYKSEAAAKAALSRLSKKSAVEASKYAIAEASEFYRSIDKKVVVINLMSGKEVVQSVNTPRCCDVSSESYWSM